MLAVESYQREIFMVKDKTINLDKKASANLRGIWDQRKKEWKVTQGWAAEQLDMTEGAVSNYLRGEMPLGIEATLRWARLLKVDPLDIRADLADLIPARSDPAINQVLLKEALATVDMIAEESGVALRIDDKAKIAILAYEEGVKLGQINKESIRTMIRYAMT